MHSFDDLLYTANIMKNTLEESILNLLHREYDKHFILESRIKSVDKIKLKYKLQIKKGLSGNANGLVPDIIGFRISVDSEDEVDKIKKIFCQNWIGHITHSFLLFDYIRSPKPSGFRAITIQYRVPFFSDEIPFEIQIMTEQMRDWTNKTHLEYDEEKYKGL